MRSCQLAVLDCASPKTHQMLRTASSLRTVAGPRSHAAEAGLLRAVERYFFIDILLVRIYFIAEMIYCTGLARWGNEFSFAGSLTHRPSINPHG